MKQWLLALVFIPLLTCGFAAGFAFDGCAAPTPTPAPVFPATPSLQPRNDEIVAVMNPTLLSGVPGDTVTLRGSLTNTTSEPYVMIGWGLVNEASACVGGNTPTCQILGFTAHLSSDPIAPHSSTGEVDIAAFKLNPAYAGPFPAIVNFMFYTTRPGMFTGITTFAIRILPQTDPSRPPVLYTAPCTQRAVALDSVFLTGEPFAPANPLNFSSDQQTRVTLFAWNMNLQPNEGAAAVKVEAIDSQQTTYALPVEFVSDVAGHPGLTQITVRLPDNLPQGTDLQLRLLVHGFTSNEAPMATKAQ